MEKYLTEKEKTETADSIRREKTTVGSEQDLSAYEIFRRYENTVKEEVYGNVGISDKAVRS